MTEGSSESVAIASELALLEREVAIARARLEAAQGITVEHKEAVREVVAEKIYGSERPAIASSPVVQIQTSTTVSPSTKPLASDHYLSTLSDEDVVKVNELISAVGTDGIQKTIDRAKNELPFILDAFHDALVDKLYDDLKARGLVT